MTTLQLGIVCLTVLILAGIAAEALRRDCLVGKELVAESAAKRESAKASVTSRFDGLKPGQQVGVQLLDSGGQSIKGVIAEVAAEYLELTTAELVTGRESTSLGTVRIAASVAQVIQRIRTE